MVERAFYVTQGSLAVWANASTDPDDAVVFADNDDGLREFDAYIASSADETSCIIVDVIEEEFAVDSIPKLRLHDRRSLMERRLQRRFPRTRYRLSSCLGTKVSGSEETMIVNSAISNHELLDPWIQIMLRHRLPLTGIFSVPLMAPSLLSRFYRHPEPTLFLTQHQTDKLRQVFIHNGHVQSARLSQSPARDDDDYPEFVLTEIKRSRQYLERMRLLGAMEQLEICIVADRDLAEKLLQLAESRSPLRFHFIDPDIAGERIGVRPRLHLDRMEAMYLATAFRKRPKRSYGVSGESQYWHLRRLRHAVIGMSIAAGAACSILAGIYLSDTWLLHREAGQIEQQLLRLTESYRRENEQFDPLKADSHEMKFAVDTGDYILSNRLPVPWVMQQIGLVMGNYPDVQIRELGWTAESAAKPARQGRAGEQVAVPVPAISAVSAELSGELIPFDGNMRKAFARIDALVAELAEKTAFEDVRAIEYPLDARPEVSVSGDILGDGRVGRASFRLRLDLPVADHAADERRGG
jgi:hypothetical protein